MLLVHGYDCYICVDLFGNFIVYYIKHLCSNKMTLIVFTRGIRSPKTFGVSVLLVIHDLPFRA